MSLEDTLSRIGLLDEEAMTQARNRLDSLVKPPGSLGRLEELAVKLAGITGNPRPRIKNKVVILMAGDHGVVEEGVSAAPQEVTYQMVKCFTTGVAGINVLCRMADSRLVVVDVGVAAPVNLPGVENRKIRYGTANIARGPAMSREEAVKALEAGLEVAGKEIERGADVIALGDMGIGNTTPSSAILAVIAGCPVEDAVGRGTLVSEKVWRQKVEVVREALRVNRPDPGDGIDILARVGGLEIAGLAGVILEASARRVPVVLDGFITTAAAMVAHKLSPRAGQFLIASHLSAEKGHRLMLEYLGLTPLLHLNMRLGEGTGAVLALQLIDAAGRIITEMASFKEAAVSDLLEDKLGI